MSTTEHVILVAFTVEATDREAAHHALMDALPEPGGAVESWWVAEDDRQDGSDNDSAVFVSPGYQVGATRVLYGAGLTPACNLRNLP